MYDAALVALSLEVCSDALQTRQKSGTQTIGGAAPPGDLRALAWRLDRHRGGRAGAGAPRAEPGGRRAGAAVERIGSVVEELDG